MGCAVTSDLDLPMIRSHLESILRIQTSSASERGASAMTIAITMVVIMGMAAIAVDVGGGFVERRLDQNTADTSVLSAGVELIVTGDVQAAVDSVKALADTNLDRTIPAADWAACVDNNALATPSDMIPGVVGGSNCISFGDNDDGVAYGRIRVRVPDQTSPSFFARVLGFGDLLTSAAAEAQLDGFGESGAFPAAVFSGAGTGDSFCIKTGTGAANSQSCGSPSTGDFGNFQPYFYTEIAPGNPSTQCTSGNQPAPLARSIADGIDHFLGIAPTAPGTRRNGANCPQFPGPLFPNRVDSGSGYSNSDITNGLVSGGSYDGNFDGRLTRVDWGATYGTATVFTEELDNRPLWAYIDMGVIDNVNYPACWNAATLGPDEHDDFTNPAEESAYVQAQLDMGSCLQGTSAMPPFTPQPNDPPPSLFLSDLYETTRLTIVPKYHQAAPIGNNSCCYDIKAFVPVFIDGIWTANGPQWNCNAGMVNDPVNGYCKHEPGRSGTIQIGPPGQRKINSASAIVLSCEVLPGVDDPAEKCRKVETGAGTVDVFLDLYLTR